jgi:hypothetical protein
MSREPELDCHFDRAAVEHGQHAGVAQIDEARLRVRRLAVPRGGARKDLARRRELGVSFEAYDELPFHVHAHS